ncbi:Cytosine permease [[Eubacterium] contortum]|uniref:Cytosine permease n=1 Tax=Faecalicatena contorta TaxID=39482 RepID=A0A174ETV7_9FIRM|nr:cytosine permease [Faecalicatena contorta]CUO40108.1 Cytosine permease [[Eubacterium] contortum] [Faecalicatena contorta]
MSEKKSGFEIAESQRQSWKSIALVWIGAMICVACLMVGGMLGEGMSIGTCIITILIGYGIVCLYMSFMGMQGCDTGLPTAVMAGGALGETGGKYVISAILAIACIGWFGIQAAVCGASFSSMIGSMTGAELPVWLCSVVWGIIMVSTACFGFKGLKWLNYIAVPLLIVVLLYGVIVAIVRNDGIHAIAVYEPMASISILSGVSLTVGSFAVGGSIAGDYCRFAKNRKDVIKSSVLGVLPAGLLILLIGAALSIITGQYDISVVLTAAGVPAIGLVALILATWTTNVTNAYSGGLSLSILLGLDEKRSRICTGIAGFVGTILAAVGIMDKFQAFLTLLCALVPAFVGVMIADYWIVGKGKKENFRIRDGVCVQGMLAFLIGAFAACLTGGTFTYFPPLASWNIPFFIGPINGIVVSMVLYVLFMKLSGRTAAEQSATSV